MTSFIKNQFINAEETIKIELGKSDHGADDLNCEFWEEIKSTYVKPPLE
jgi:hypothetical protein